MFQPFNEGSQPEAHWEDVIRFNHSSNPRSGRRDPTATSSYYEVDDENTPLLARIITPTKKNVVYWTNSFWKRTLILNIAPVLVVAAWCAVPIPFTETSAPSNVTSSTTATIVDHFNLTLSSSPLQTFSGHEKHILNPRCDRAVDLDFWFFLFFYYGIYNAVALLFITKVFSIYGLNWWPNVLGGKVAYLMFWVVAEAIGTGIYFNPWFPDIKSKNLTWVFLTFVTMALPLLLSWLVLRSESRNVFRNSLTEVQKALLPQEMPGTPWSYKRFLWFCAALLLALFAFVAGEAFTTIFLDTLPHGPIGAILSVYAWVAVIYLLDAIADWIMENKINCYPLTSIFKLYFMTTYFIFYRNIFARLRSVDQFAIMQVGSSLWVCIFFPICMTRWVYDFLVTWFGITSTYEDYKKRIGRSFYTRNVAENTTMLGFLLWSSILHFGPNKRAYPYFQFRDIINDPHYKYTFELTFFASLVIWVTELISALVTRHVFKRFFNHSVTQEAIKDFGRYPEMIVAFFLLLVHVMQHMLLALLCLEFEYQ